MALTFDVLWRDHGAARGLHDLKTQTGAASQGFQKLEAASARASDGLQRAQNVAAESTRRLKLAEMRLQELRDSGKGKATQMLAAENAVASARTRASTATDRVTKASAQMQQAQQREVEALKNSRGAYSAVAGTVSHLGSIGGAALTGLAAGAVTVGVKTAANMETARIGFTTMLGSAQKADAFLKQLADFAAATPFEFPELQTAASSLISVGIDANKVIPIMTTLGNVTSGMGTGSEGIQRATVALQQMTAAQRISAEDLNQLRDAGIPVYDLLAAATGKSKAEVVKLAQAGKLGKKELDAMMNALETGKGLERFNGLMQKTSTSLTGLWSTLKDTFSQGMAKEIAPLLPMLKDGLSGAISLTAGHLGEAAAAAGAFFAVMTVQKVGKLVGKLAEMTASMGRVSGALRGASSFLGGPWGIAIGLGVTVLGAFALKQHEAQVETDAFSKTLTYQNGVLDQNSRQMIVKKLADDRSLASVKNAGVSEKDYVAALLAGGPARQQMIDQLNSIAESHRVTTMTAGGTIQTTDGVGLAAKAAATTLQTMGSSLDEEAGAAKLASSAMLGVDTSQHQVATSSTTLATLTKTLTAKEASLNTELQKSIDKFTILKQGALDVGQADMAWQASIDAVSQSVKTNGHSLDIHTDKGRANRTAIIGMMTALNDKTTADVKSAGVVHKGETATDAYSRVLRVATTDTRNGERQIRAAAKAAGLNADQVNAMIRQYLKTPKQVITDIKTHGVRGALGDIHNVQGALHHVASRSVDIHFTTNAGKIGDFISKAGSRITSGGHFAGGGTVFGYSPHPRADNIPAMLTAGEEVINAPQAAKHRPLLKAINSGAEGFADGGTIGRSLTINAGRVPTSAMRVSGIADSFTGAFAKAAGSVLGKAFAAAMGGGGGPISGGGFANALAFARSQVGAPYTWAAAGPRSVGYDCSGFMGAIQNVIYGQAPYHRRWSTSAFQGQAHAMGFTRNKRSAFMIGVTNAGVGHTAGTLNGVNVESSGGRGVHIGPGARGWNNSLFPMHYGLADGGTVGNLPFDLVDPRGEKYDPDLVAALLGKRKLHTGGLVTQPGVYSLAERGPERVLSTPETRIYDKMVRIAGRGGGAGNTYIVNVSAPHVYDAQGLERALVKTMQTGRLDKVIQRTATR